MRELLWMADGARRERWDHTSNLLAIQANIHRPRGRQPINAKEMHPYHGKQVVKLSSDESIAVLMRAFGVKKDGA